MNVCVPSSRFVELNYTSHQLKYVISLWPCLGYTVFLLLGQCINSTEIKLKINKNEIIGHKWYERETNGGIVLHQM